MTWTRRVRRLLTGRLLGSAGVTNSRDTLKPVTSSPHKNVTLSLPEPLLRRFRVYAASKNRSMTALAADAIRQMMQDERQDAASKRRFLERVRNAPNRGTDGRIRWSREELHERGVR
jgi:hypothetical protein